MKTDPEVKVGLALMVVAAAMFFGLLWYISGFEAAAITAASVLAVLIFFCGLALVS